MGQEKISEQHDEQARLTALYEQLYDEGLFIKEWSAPKGFMAMVGGQAELKLYLGLADDEELTAEHIANLGMIILFMPGAGATRVEAIQSAYDAIGKGKGEPSQPA